MKQERLATRWPVSTRKEHMKLLDAKEVRVGMRVVKVSGERQNTMGTVKGVDVGANLIGVLFDGDAKTTFASEAREFQVLKKPFIRLMGRPPPDTIARGSL